jgi:hypothetical protein
MKWLRSGQVAWSEFHLSGKGVYQGLSSSSLRPRARGQIGHTQFWSKYSALRRNVKYMESGLKPKKGTHDETS